MRSCSESAARVSWRGLKPQRYDFNGSSGFLHFMLKDGNRTI